MKGQVMRTLACSIVVAMVSTPSIGCGGRAEGAQREMPPRPALGRQIERVGRPLTGNALLGLMAPAAVSNARKEAYNRAAPDEWPQFTADIERGLALYDGFDRSRGNQWLADRTRRYHALATLLADDRLWVNANARVCTRFLAVELAALARTPAPNDDCGGRTPNYDAVDVFRSMLMTGTATGLEDGVAHDERVHSTTEFPFLAAP